jgi:hypothetical protein
VDLIGPAIDEARTARADDNHERAEILMGHADLLESELVDLADRFDID